jgi:hypothetical protein
MAAGVYYIQTKPMSNTIRTTLKLLVCTVLLLSSSSCSFIFKTVGGYRKLMPVSDKEHRRLLKKLDANPDFAFSADTNYILRMQSDFPDSSHFLMIKNHYQPVQMILFGHSRYKSYHLPNCYAPGVPHLAWNKGGRLDQYPPINGAPIDSLITFDKLIGYFKPFGHQQVYTVGPSEPNTVVMLWSRLIFKESKRLNRYIKKNLKLANEPYRILYVNLDNMFYDLDADDEK